jgi:CubicO group peptidase (beta-lactamase class C family)
VALGAFVDGLIRAQMEQLHIPSAVVAVVQGERTLYTAGYGYADIATRRPVDPASSMFHIGSTGKLFTWTAVMQLVEQGKLDLDKDINTYLKTFQVPAAFGAPITLRHLMTHTAGFQEGILGYFIGNDSTNIRSIEETLRRHIPARVRPPGEFASYSNYGASLAGLIVEQVSGEPFAEYIERHIYQPLGIRYATFREPLPAALRPHAVTGYSIVDGAFKAMPFEIDGGFVPSGGTVMSAGDMARFMSAHLQLGRLGDSVILQPATARMMQTRAFAHDQRLPGTGLGFIEETFRGHRVIGHSGDSEYFHVDMVLVPDQQLGLFVAYGGEASTMAREKFKAAFFGRYLVPVDTVAASIKAGSTTGYVGQFRPIRMNYTDIDKLVYLVALAPISVEGLEGGRLLVSGSLTPDWAPTQFEPIGPALFREVGGEQLIAFRVDSSGHATHFLSDPTVAAERIPWNESPSFWYPVLAMAMVVMVSVLIDALYRRVDPASRRTRRLATLTAAWPFLTLLAAGLVVGVYRMSILERIPVALKLVLAMPVIFLGLTTLLAAAAARSWRQPVAAGRRLHLTLAALAAISLCWFCWQWNILGWQFG